MERVYGVWSIPSDAGPDRGVDLPLIVENPLSSGHTNRVLLHVIGLRGIVGAALAWWFPDELDGVR
jgi:NhaP-type Na+/H+ or K+/H+ antiporter